MIISVMKFKNFLCFIKSNYKLIILIIILLSFNSYEVKKAIDRLYGNLDNLIATTEKQRKEEVYKFMGYRFVKEIVNPIKDGGLMPYLQYISHDYGVKVILDGLRNNDTKDLAIVIGLDNILKNRNGSKLKCDRQILEEIVQLKCLMPDGIYHITGIKFLEKITSGKSFKASYICNNRIVNSHVFTSDNIFHTELLDNLLKIPHEKFDYYDTISNKVANNDYCEVTIEGGVKDIPEFILTGHLKNIGEHYILKWDAKDARNYFAISKNIVDNSGNITNFSLQEAVNQSLSGY
jgi:hypothetical protein